MTEERYPIGMQSFEMLRNRNCIYIDKTKYIYDLANSGSTTFFLSRPRRFGKSLFLSTLEAYFKGRKELFEGLAIYELEKDWECYPVLRFDLSTAEAKTTVGLRNSIEMRLRIYAEEYGIALPQQASLSDQLGFLIEKIVKTTGKHVVILVDEYDKGVVDVLDNETQLEANEDILRPFFAQMKAQNANIRFCFITGVARFRHYTIFSGFNSTDDLSMQTEYAAICGITIDELLANFNQGIQKLAENLDTTFDEVVAQLKQKYDGYRFTKAPTLVFNPFSILNSMKSRDLGNYWIKSGTSRVFVNFLSKYNFDLDTLTDLWVTQEEMEGTFDRENPIPLLFQTGYLTIKECRSRMFRLDIPNGEVRNALVDELMPQFMGLEKIAFNHKFLLICDLLKTGDVDGLMRELTALIAKVPYHEFDYKEIEKTYHLIVYSIFLMLGVEVNSEIAMSGGRIDMVATTSKFVYVMEFKLDGTASEAMEQINSKGYALPWQADSRTVIKIGVAFSSQTHTIAEWVYQKENS